MYAEAFEEALKVDGEAGHTSDGAINSLRDAFVKSGWPGFLRAALGRVLPQDSPVVAAWHYAMVGDRERALKKLEQAYDDKDFFLAFVKVEPAFDDLRADPRFRVLLRRMNFGEDHS